MLNILNTRILLSIASITAAVALVVGATFAFFTDTETSTGNTFAAGSLDLQVDSQAHYAGLVCNASNKWVLEAATTTRPDLEGDECDGTWTETDLGLEHKFFNLLDVKPGDTGEDTISLHVIDNDAWGRLIIDNDQDLENTCNDEETEAGDGTCTGADGDGELQENLQFHIWLDQGAAPGFQGQDDGEGDNIFQERDELVLVTPGPLDAGGETLNIWEGLVGAYSANSCVGSGEIDDPTTSCPGLAPDGQMIGSITYYFGLGWELPDDVGNNIQTDSLIADMTFEVEQSRNNTTPFGP